MVSEHTGVHLRVVTCINIFFSLLPDFIRNSVCPDYIQSNSFNFYNQLFYDFHYRNHPSIYRRCAFINREHLDHVFKVCYRIDEFIWSSMPFSVQLFEKCTDNFILKILRFYSKNLTKKDKSILIALTAPM